MAKLLDWRNGAPLQIRAVGELAAGADMSERRQVRARAGLSVA